MNGDEKPIEDSSNDNEESVEHEGSHENSQESSGESKSSSSSEHVIEIENVEVTAPGVTAADISTATTECLAEPEIPENQETTPEPIKTTDQNSEEIQEQIEPETENTEDKSDTEKKSKKEKKFSMKKRKLIVNLKLLKLPPFWTVNALYWVSC